MICIHLYLGRRSALHCRVIHYESTWKKIAFFILLTLSWSTDYICDICNLSVIYSFNGSGNTCNVLYVPALCARQVIDTLTVYIRILIRCKTTLFTSQCMQHRLQGWFGMRRRKIRSCMHAIMTPLPDIWEWKTIKKKRERFTWKGLNKQVIELVVL